jgi:hypothetical protein
VQSDPIGLAGGIASFAYSGSNPTLNVDEHGLKWKTSTNKYTRGGNEMIILCRGGKVVFDTSGFDDFGCSELSTAARIHENSHLKDVDPKVCECKPDNVYVGNDNDAERLGSERKAFQAELTFLKREMGHMKSGPCKSKIRKRIDDIEGRIIPCVNSGGYPSCAK